MTRLRARQQRGSGDRAARMTNGTRPALAAPWKVHPNEGLVDVGPNTKRSAALSERSASVRTTYQRRGSTATAPRHAVGQRWTPSGRTLRIPRESRMIPYQLNEVAHHAAASRTRLYVSSRSSETS